MNKIRLLSLQEIQKIAAGEVVERPANVVKELVENALDAQATYVEIVIKDGGESFIGVTDNGCGMSPEDARLSVAPHATSKISCVDDLVQLATFGFRGEALASMCAVSNFTLKTKRESDDVGLQLTFKNGSLEKEEIISCSTGTTIWVANLFANIPARKKFLKVPETEMRHITQFFQATALSNPAIHFKLMCDNKLVQQCPPAENTQMRIVQLWGHHMAQNMLPITASHEQKQLAIEGLISNHQFQRFNTANIFLFVNQRWVKNSNLIKAFIRGYQQVLPPGKYPAGVLFIQTDPANIDVNIHPRKEEVQFLHERAVEQLIQQTIKQTLETHVNAQIATTFAPVSHAPNADFTNTASAWQPVASPIPEWAAYQPIMPPAAAHQTPVYEQQTVSHTAPVSQLETHRIIGQYHNTYIIIENEQGLVLIDQHAAHERILYELFAKRFQEVACSQLLFPIVVAMTHEEAQSLIDNASILATHGIAIDRIANDRIAIRSVPVNLKNADLSGLLAHCAALFTESHSTIDILHERIRAQMACKAAVKAGDALSTQQINELLTQLSQTNNRLTCPHGRPTTWVIPLSDIEKRFKRI